MIREITVNKDGRPWHGANTGTTVPRGSLIPEPRCREARGHWHRNRTGTRVGAGAGTTFSQQNLESELIIMPSSLFVTLCSTCICIVLESQCTIRHHDTSSYNPQCLSHSESGCTVSSNVANIIVVLFDDFFNRRLEVCIQRFDRDSH